MAKLGTTNKEGFALLEAFFTDHQAALLHKPDVPSRLAYLLEHFTFEQLLKKLSNDEVAYLKQVNGKCQATAAHYCSLVKKLSTGSGNSSRQKLKKIKSNYREQCEQFCKQVSLSWL